MASSSNRKSNSSASKASKPTFRRAGGKGSPRPVASPSSRPAQPARKAPSKPISSYSPRTKAGKPSAGSLRQPRSSAVPRPRAAGQGSVRSGAPKRLGTPAGMSAARRPLAQKPAQKKPLAQAPATQKPAKQKPTKQKPTKQKAVAVHKKTSPRPFSATSVTSVAAQPRTARSERGAGPVARVLGAVGGVFATIGRLIGHIASARALAIAIAAVVVLGVAGVVVANSPIFAATNIVVEGSEHVSAETVKRLISVPDGTTLLNVDTAAIASSLEENPWVSGVSVEREWPNTLRIVPKERAVSAIVYITADDIAWAVGDDGCWIAPVSLSVQVDAEGNVIDTATGSGTSGADGGDGADTAATEGGDGTELGQDTAAATAAQQLSGTDAARALARSSGVLLFTDVPADIEPSTGQEVTSDVVLAGLKYANGFSDAFKQQIQSLSLPSVDAITAYLTSGIEVALGEPTDIETKERVVTRLLEQQEGVTYINVRVPDSYSFRSAPAA